jgi:hypothetical protein
MSLTLALTPNPPEAFTPTSVSHLLELSQSLINTLPGRPNPPPPPVGLTINWSSAKGDLETKLYKATHNKEPWVARVSVASDISYNQLLHALLLEKCETERTVLMREDDEQEYVGEERVMGEVKVQGMYGILRRVVGVTRNYEFQDLFSFPLAIPGGIGADIRGRC